MNTPVRNNGNGHRRTRQDYRPQDNAAPFEAPSPKAIEAEMALLGAMILSHDTIGDVIGIVSATDFTQARHAALYQTIIDLWNTDPTRLDLVILKQHLAERNLLADLGGIEYLVELCEGTPHYAGAGHYARIVAQTGRRRRGMEAMHEGFDLLKEGGDVAEALAAIEQKVFELAAPPEQVNDSTLGEAMHTYYQQLEAREGQMISGLETGFFELDDMLGGLQRGEMIVVAGRPSMGKSSWAMNAAMHAAGRGFPVAIFSLEMSREQFGERIICSEAKLDSRRLRRNMLSGDEFRRVAEVVGKFTDAPVHLAYCPGLTTMDLRARARRLHRKHDLKLIVVDYLQLMTDGTRNESRQVEVSAISRGVKALARELDLPVIAVCQLNRMAENRADHRPRMSDLRESGSLEQDADVVMLLHREGYYTQADPNHQASADDDLAELIIAKQRNGPTGTVKLLWDAAATSFRNLAHQDQQRYFGQ